MEEIVYSRSVTKQAMSGRVVDKMQIDRHYRMNELSELYTFTPCNLSRRPAPNMPADEILKALLHQYPDRAFKYHDHDSLLENKPEQDLSEEEIKEAWQLYEQESRGVPAQRPLGPQMPMMNDLTASMYQSNLFAAASGLDSTAGLFQQLYPSVASAYNSPFDYLMPFDLSAAFRNPLASQSVSKAITGGIPTPPTASSLLRNQLNTSNMPFSSLANPFSNPFPTTSITKAPIGPITQKRRPSVPKQQQQQLQLPPVTTSNNSNLNSLASLQQRIIRKNVENPTQANSSANLSILPDPESPLKRNPLPSTKVNQANNKIRPNPSQFNVPKQLQPQKTVTSGLQLQQQQRIAPNGSQVPRSQSSVNLQSSQKSSNGVIQKSPSLQRITGVVPKTPPMQSSGAARTISVKNINSLNKGMPAVMKPTIRPMNTSGNIQQKPQQQQQVNNIARPLVVPQNKNGSAKQVEVSPVRLTPQQSPQLTTKIVQIGNNSSLKPRTFVPPGGKIVMQPQHRITPKVVPANQKPASMNTNNNNHVPKSIQMLANSASPISITKLPLQGGTKIAPKPVASSSGSISLHKIPKSGNAQQQSMVTGVVPRSPVLSQKRQIEVRIYEAF
jgi:hypothetical protein